MFDFRVGGAGTFALNFFFFFSCKRKWLFCFHPPLLLFALHLHALRREPSASGNLPRRTVFCMCMWWLMSGWLLFTRSQISEPKAPANVDRTPPTPPPPQLPVTPTAWDQYPNVRTSKPGRLCARSCHGTEKKKKHPCDGLRLAQRGGQTGGQV